MKMENMEGQCIGFHQQRWKKCNCRIIDPHKSRRSSHEKKEEEEEKR